MVIVWAQVSPACTPEHTEKGIVRNFTKKMFQWGFHVDDMTRDSTDEKTCSGKSITPKMKRHEGMC
jgi:hypothetical protein